MNKKQQQRAKVLLKAAYDILNSCNEGVFVEDVMEVSAVWDGVECDGACLMNEIGQLLDIIDYSNECDSTESDIF